MSDVPLNSVVTATQHLSPWLMRMTVAPTGWSLPPFAPGQFVSLGLPESAPRCRWAAPELQPPRPGKLIRRAYSIASSPQRPDAEFYLSLVPAGGLSPRLFELHAGDALWMSKKVTGRFTLERVQPHDDVVLVATGAGLAPFLSMVASDAAPSPDRRVVLLHGVRTPADLGYRDSLSQLAIERPGFLYVPIVSRPLSEPCTWAGRTGHVQDVFASGDIDHLLGRSLAPEHTHVFLCGAPAMIDDMARRLGEHGFLPDAPHSPGRLHTEKYWDEDAEA